MVLRPVALAGKYCLLSRSGTRADAPVAESRAAALLSTIFPPSILVVMREERNNTHDGKDLNASFYTFFLRTSRASMEAYLLYNELVRMMDTR